MSEDSSCNIMGFAGMAVQGVLALLAFGSLIGTLTTACAQINFLKSQKMPRKAKESLENLDTSKQIGAGFVLHFLNIATAYLLSEEGADPCGWYVVTITFDTSFGMLSCCIILSMADHIFERTGKTHLKSGNYFKEVSVQDPINFTVDRKVAIDVKAWLYQLLIWLGIVVLSKVIQFIVQNFLKDPLNSLSGWLLSGLDDFPTLKLIIALFVIPLTLTAIQFWVVDNFIKKQKFDQNEIRLLKDGFFEDLEESMAEVEIEIGSTYTHKQKSIYNPPNSSDSQTSHSSTKFEDEPEITTAMS